MPNMNPQTKGAKQAIEWVKNLRGCVVLRTPATTPEMIRELSKPHMRSEGGDEAAALAFQLVNKLFQDLSNSTWRDMWDGEMIGGNGTNPYKDLQKYKDDMILSLRKEIQERRMDK